MDRLDLLGQPTTSGKIRQRRPVVYQEVGGGNLDTLAAYSDGRVRYINHTGKMALLEAAPTNIEGKVKELIAAAQETARQIGPWNKSSLPPVKAREYPIDLSGIRRPSFWRGAI
jgi:hypothetical protein